jgi:small ligand-binding sensory domain FIST
MTDDLVKRLRETGEGDMYLAPTKTKMMIDEAADRIEEIEAALSVAINFISTRLSTSERSRLMSIVQK